MSTTVKIILCAGLLAAAAAARAATGTLPLEGAWQFALDPGDAGLAECWFDRALPHSIRLPGMLQSQGYGDEISIDTPWVLSLYDHLWFLRDDYRAWTNAGAVKVPFLCQPPRHYLGAAWYRRDIEIPADWGDRRVALFLERPHWETRVWLDGAPLGSNVSLCAPHEYQLGTALKPGRHSLAIRVDNRLVLLYRPDAHSVSDSLGGAWNGIAGKIQLRSTPTVWLDSVDLYPIPKETNKVRVVARLGNVSGQAGTGVISVPAARTQIPVVWDAAGGRSEFECALPPGQSFWWDEFSPNLGSLDFQLSTGDAKSVRFGLRTVGTGGGHFFINGRQTEFRGTHNGGDFPLTGYPPTDVDSWKRLIRVCQNWGLNLMRFHSWCPPEAAFAAADELGFYLQPECGMWNEISPGTAMEKMLYEETDRMIAAYGNHPSFVLLSPSNEPKGRWKQSLPKWVGYCRRQDPRRLYTPGTGWSIIDSPGPVEGADYLAVSRIGPNPLRGKSAWFGGDYAESLAGVNVPVLSHELGQWCAYPDFSVIAKFTGAMRPGNYEIFRDSLAAHGLLDQDARFAWASGRFQLACYKEEIEANLRTPGLDGFELLDLHDYTGQGTALVGLLDTFWEEKSYATPDEFRHFCNTTVLLARLRHRILTTADTLEAEIEAAHFGAAPLPGAAVAWQIVGASNQVLAAGTFPAATLPIGKNIPLGRLKVGLGNVAAPQACVLQVSIQGTPFRNEWNFWVYPASAPPGAPANVLVTRSWEQAAQRLAAGGRVLFLPRNTDLDWTCPPLDSVPVFWNRLMNPAWGRMLGLWCDTNHPALAGFPTAANCDWQWAELLRGVRAVNLDRFPRSLRPIVAAIDDWNRNWKLAPLFECHVGPGRLMVCSFDLTSKLESRPAARQLRRSLLDYLAGPRFEPPCAAAAADVENILFDTTIMRRLGARAEGEGDGRAAIDGDPNTAWVRGGTGRGQSGTSHPHALTVTFPAPAPINGLCLMPRQNDRDHAGDTRAYTVEVSDDGREWREVARGELVSTWAPQRVPFGQTVSARHLRFTALSGFGRDASTAIAELAVLYAGPKLPETAPGDIEFQPSRSTSTDVDEGRAPIKP
ncbi:MAG: discoidin domain-containing protein [Verrucomicrobiota bacterium]|jgi:hypothetical protein